MPLQTSRKPNTTQQWIPQSRGVLLSSRKQRLDPGWVWYSLPVLSGTQAPLLKLFHMCPHPDGSYSLTHQVERFQPAGREWGHRRQPHPPLVSISSWPGLGYKGAGKCSPCSGLPCGQSEVPYRGGNRFGGTTSNVRHTNWGQ